MVYNNNGLCENNDLIKGLLEAKAYPHETSAIQLMETHIIDTERNGVLENLLCRLGFVPNQ